MGTVTPNGQRTYRTLIYRSLLHLNLLEAGSVDLDPVCPNPKIVSHTDCLANHAGLFRTQVKVGDAIEAGRILGTIYDLAGQILEEVRSPAAGIIGILRTFSSAQPGDRLVQVFRVIKGAREA